MNKVDVGKALRTLHDDMAANRAPAPVRPAEQGAPQPAAPAPPGPAPAPPWSAAARPAPTTPRPALRRQRSRPSALQSDEFPAGMHPDDWEPDWEDEPESARAIARLARYFSPPPTP